MSDELKIINPNLRITLSVSRGGFILQETLNPTAQNQYSSRATFVKFSDLAISAEAFEAMNKFSNTTYKSVID